MPQKTLRILGIRGVPAAHGGFETFAEHLALYLVEKGWRVIVYCQEDGIGPRFEDTWQGVERVHFPIENSEALGTILFDWKATVHAAQHKDLCLTLGYNTAAFCSVLRLKNIPNLINMDGIEWSRAKWGPVAKAWFWLNEWAGCFLGNHLIADHPEIKTHLQTRVNAKKITTIPYGADAITEASTAVLEQYQLEPGRYFTVIARPEPENSLLEIVRGFSATQRNYKLVVLGNYHAHNAYHQAVKNAASSEVLFTGAIYDKSIVQALRFHSAAYIHGHQVGGTNPSLVEALGAGNAIIAHDNRFNRWVAGEGGVYFSNKDDFSQRLSELLASPDQLAQLQAASKLQFQTQFTWPQVLAQYEQLLTQYVPR
ncbi:MAG: DUF1972 domain-containing protein [Marinagarivorans sp.]